MVLGADIRLAMDFRGRAVHHEQEWRSGSDRGWRNHAL